MRYTAIFVLGAAVGAVVTIAYAIVGFAAGANNNWE